MIRESTTNDMTFNAVWLFSARGDSTCPLAPTAQQYLRYLPPGPLGFGLTIVSAIVVNVENDEDGEFVVTDCFSTIYGNGNTESCAINDYCLSLIDYYEILETQPRTPAVIVALQRIRSYVDRIRDAKATGN